MNPTQDPITRRAEAIRYRNPALVLDLLALLEVEDLDRPLLCQRVAGRHEVTDSTVAHTLADLNELGAIRSVYRRAQKRTDYRVTPLGRAWLRGNTADPEIPNIGMTTTEQGARPHWADGIEEEQ